MSTIRSKIRIVPVMSVDFGLVYRMWQRSGLEVKDRRTERNEFEAMVSLNPSSCLVAKADRSIVGSVFGIWNGRRAWVYHLAVLPEWQGYGIGSGLLQEAEKVLLSRNGRKIRLWVNFTNLKAVTFYEKHGYRVISDAIMLGKDLVKGGDTHE